MTDLTDPSDDEFSRRVARAVAALPDAPLALQRAAIALWPAAAPALSLGAAAGMLLRHVAAVLSFDSWAAPALAHGMRSLRSPTRHLLYSAQGRDIDLRIAPVGEAFSIAGQILGPDESGAVELAPLDANAEGAARVVQLDALGEFRLDGLPRGPYRLTLRTASEAIVVAALEVGEPAG